MPTKKWLSPPLLISTVIIVTQLCCISSSSSSPFSWSSSSSNNNDDANGDKIVRLVGQPSAVSFQQFSGYISVLEDEQQQRHNKQERALFYYFAEAETDPHSKPLVLWLTGGPPCSSLVSAFTEHGPFKQDGNDSLATNHYSWNKVANMLYLESPAGVGFSYSSNKSFYAYVNDAITARDNLRFLQNWVKRFPAYKNRDLFLTGESYAGHYISQLADLVSNSDLKPNLKGILLGVPLLDYNTDFNSRADYYWSHGLISDSTFELLNNVCNFSEITRQTSINGGKLTPACSRVSSQAQKENTIGVYIDSSDVSDDLCRSSAQNFTPIICNSEDTPTYLNRKDVQRAIHAKLVGVNQWVYCSEVINYDLHDLEIPILPLLSKLIKSGVRVLAYSGDRDPTIPFIGTRKGVSRLAIDLELNTTVPYQPWLLDGKVAGWTQVYGDLLSYVVIRGSGHLAPISQPERSLFVFTKFLERKSLPVLAQ